MQLSEYITQATLDVSKSWMDEVTLGKTPFQHQIADLKFMGHSVRSGLFNDPGTGKTLPLQGFGLYQVSQGAKGIFLMPPILIPQFMNSFRANYQGVEKHVNIVAFNAPPLVRAQTIRKWVEEGYPDILVMSYAIFVKFNQENIHEGGGRLEKTFKWVVVDEATAVKSSTSQIHGAVHAFVNAGVENCVVLATGTPVETNIEDCYGIIRLINPRAYSSARNFEVEHVEKDSIYNPKTGKDMRITTGYKNLDKLHHNLYACARRVKKSDVSDLPPRLISEYIIELSKPHMKLYRKMVNDRILEIGDELVDMTTAQALYQAMQQVLLNPEKYGADIKDNALFEVLDEIVAELDGRKVVVYAWFNATVDTICERYKHLNPAKINGTVTGDSREAEKQKFITDDTCKMVVANPKSGGVGVDGFQHVCSHVIYAEVCPFVGTFQQSVDRLHRTGQESSSVNVYILVAKDTVAVKLRNNLIKKDSYQESVMKDKRAILADLVGEEGIRGSLDELQ